MNCFMNLDLQSREALSSADCIILILLNEQNYIPSDEYHMTLQLLHLLYYSFSVSMA